ncbi:MAG: hypothetical protein CM15mV67_360 [uncultured marine virus]|nr:MAG: hypothetical protein CM15mV67_360 [uncultured marine virus]
MHTKEVYQHLGIQELLLYQLTNGKMVLVKQLTSHTSRPYDVVKQPFSAALKTLEEGKVRQGKAGNVAWNLMLGEDGPVRKLLDPFFIRSNLL